MSLKVPQYETVEEARTRLLHGVVLYDGSPVYITRIEKSPEAGDERFRVFTLPCPLGAKFLRGEERAEGEVRKLISSKKFDMAAGEMGYVDMGDVAVQVSRTTKRQYSQALTRGNVSIRTPTGDPHNYQFSDLLKTGEFGSMFAGKYSDFKTQREKLEHSNKVKSVAVSKQFALQQEGDDDFGLSYLYNRNQRCGIVLPGSKVVRVPKKFQFLREELEDCRVPFEVV